MLTEYATCPRAGIVAATSVGCNIIAAQRLCPKWRPNGTANRVVRTYAPPYNNPSSVLVTTI